MKGVILAGGKGTRLYPCTLVINKHLLPIYNKPMIYYPLETLKKAGCNEILIITGGENPGEFMRLIKNGKELGFDNVYYTYQENANGIADALYLAKNFIGKDKFCVILGDNLIFDDITNDVKNFLEQPSGSSHIFIKRIENPTSFGVAEIEDNKVINIVEKPSQPKTDLAVVGLYMYDEKVFDIIDKIQPSARGEYEITTVNQIYANNKMLNFSILDMPWVDTGTIDSLYHSQNVIYEMVNN